MPLVFEPIRVLFVCLGNICRSPLAEAVVRRHADHAGIGDQFHFGSAGTGDWNLGLPPDPRTSRIARQHGLSMEGHRAYQITEKDIGNWHWFVAMDEQNRADLLALGAPAGRILLMRQFEGNCSSQEIPDPYAGPKNGFENTYDILENSVGPLLDHLLAQGQLRP